jgi:hypothetical protein
MTANRKFTISGPGAADFLASPGGEDLPGTSTSKGTSQTRDEESLTNDARNFEPAFGIDGAGDSGLGTRDSGSGTRGSKAARNNDAAGGPQSGADERTGSQTGTIGGGGADAHNPAPVRATGVDDPTAAASVKPSKKRTTKKY